MIDCDARVARSIRFLSCGSRAKGFSFNGSQNARREEMFRREGCEGENLGTENRHGSCGKPPTFESIFMEKTFNRMAGAVAHATGRPWAFALCTASVLIWAATGPVFHYSETWQLVINTGTTIITFLMVFLIQNTQNRDGAAIQVKLDELIRSGLGKNDFIGIEHLTEREVEAFRRACEAAKTAKASEG